MHVYTTPRVNHMHVWCVLYSAMRCIAVLVETPAAANPTEHSSIPVSSLSHPHLNLCACACVCECARARVLAKVRVTAACERSLRLLARVRDSTTLTHTLTYKPVAISDCSPHCLAVNVIFETQVQSSPVSPTSVRMRRSPQHSCRRVNTDRVRYMAALPLESSRGTAGHSPLRRRLQPGAVIASQQAKSVH